MGCNDVLCLVGVESYDIDIKEQKVIVVGSVKLDVVLDCVLKIGKVILFWSDESVVKIDFVFEDVVVEL